MCLGCYAEQGFPKIVTPATLAIAALSKRVYEFNGVGGNLHVILDDWNLGDEFFEGEMRIHHESSEGQLAAERACYAALKSLSEDEEGGGARPTGRLPASRWNASRH